MAENNIAQQMDKIAYAVAGVVGIVLVALPLTLGGDADEKIAGVQKKLTELEAKVGKEYPEIPDPQVPQTIQKNWNVGTANPKDPRWVTEIAPFLHKKLASEKPQQPEHVAGEITEIRVERDPEKMQPYLVVQGRLSPENKDVVLRELDLFRKEGDGDFKKILDFSAKGDFEYADYDVNPGERYTYKFASVMERDPKAADNVSELDPADVRKESAALGPTPPVPYDFSLKINQILTQDDPTKRPEFIGAFKYWDYGKNKLVEVRRFRPTRLREKMIFGQRFWFWRVDRAERTVIVRDKVRNTRFTIKASRKDRTEFPIELWPPIQGGGGAEPEETVGEEPPETPQPEKKASTKKAKGEGESKPAEEESPKPRRRSRRRFGDGG